MRSEEVDLAIKTLKHLTSKCNIEDFADLKSFYESLGKNFVSISDQNKAIKTVLAYIEKVEKNESALSAKLVKRERQLEELKELKEPQNKIRDKINELEEIIYYAGTEEGMCELKDYEYDKAKYGIEVLKELLEGE